MIQGYYFPHGSSRRLLASITVDDRGFLRLHDEQGALLADGRWQQLQISPRLGSTPRFLDFADGSRFETSDNDAVDGLQQCWRQERGYHLLHRLESHWRLALASVVVVAVVSWWFLTIALPYAASQVAFVLPASALDRSAELSLSVMERIALKPSTLDEARQQQLQGLLVRLLPQSPAYNYRLLLRDGGAFGANAFALPDGTIVMTDQLVALADDDRQLSAVLAHEIGHVEARHSLRQVLQGSVIMVIAAVMAGDATAFGDLVGGVPTAVMDASYSRDFEREADRYALTLLASQGVDSEHFAVLLERLAASHDQADDTDVNYFSSHPPTAERVAAARAF
ncbi:MAG: M48 family metallopeptidase [Gammaproteobacteria bacterium]|nr:M48 family metallopeptidase [Gammaproteobacteria bacterium]